MSFGAYKYKDTQIGVTKLPGRKRPCLYVQKKNVIYPLAYFTSEDKAEMFWKVFKMFVEGE